MDRDTAVSIIMRRLGNRSGIESQIITDMQLAQTELEQATERPWFLLNFRQALVNETSPTDAILLLDDFLTEWKDGLLEYEDEDGNWHKLDKRDFKALNQVDANNFTAPSFYGITKDRLIIVPDPAEVLNFRWSYWAKDTVLDSNVENEWLAKVPEVLICATGIKTATFIEAAAKIQAFTSGFNTAYGAMKLMSQKFFEANESMYLEYGGSYQ